MFPTIASLHQQQTETEQPQPAPQPKPDIFEIAQRLFDRESLDEEATLP